MQKSVKTPEQALSTIMSLCAKAERSSGDARRLMIRWGVEERIREEILDRLIKGRFIDDRRYAAAYVREKSNLSGWGIYKIRTSLAAKGIDRNIVEEAVAQINMDASQDILKSLIERKARTVKAANNYDLKGKLVRFGLSRGFDYEQILNCVEKFLKTEE